MAKLGGSHCSAFDERVFNKIAVALEKPGMIPPIDIGEKGYVQGVAVEGKDYYVQADKILRKAEKDNTFYLSYRFSLLAPSGRVLTRATKSYGHPCSYLEGSVNQNESNRILEIALTQMFGEKVPIETPWRLGNLF